MQWGEICSDPFESAFAPVPKVAADELAEQAPVMRGGAALFEPWKDQSWPLCICGARWDTQDYAPDRYALRLVLDIPKPRKPRKAK